MLKCTEKNTFPHPHPPTPNPGRLPSSDHRKPACLLLRRTPGSPWVCAAYPEWKQRLSKRCSVPLTFHLGRFQLGVPRIEPGVSRMPSVSFQTELAKDPKGKALRLPRGLKQLTGHLGRTRAASLERIEPPVPLEHRLSTWIGQGLTKLQPFV